MQKHSIGWKCYERQREARSALNGFFLGVSEWVTVPECCQKLVPTLPQGMSFVFSPFLLLHFLLLSHHFCFGIFLHAKELQTSVVGGRFSIVFKWTLTSFTPRSRNEENLLWVSPIMIPAMKTWPPVLARWEPAQRRCERVWEPGTWYPEWYPLWTPDRRFSSRWEPDRWEYQRAQQPGTWWPNTDTRHGNQTASVNMKGHENLGRRYPWWYPLWKPDWQFSLRCENRLNETMKEGYEDLKGMKKKVVLVFS